MGWSFPLVIIYRLAGGGQKSRGIFSSKLAIKKRPRFQKFLFPQGIPYIRGSGFGTAELGRIFELNQKFDADKSQLVAPTGFEPVYQA